MMRVAVLGSGIAGLLSAKAATEWGARVTIYTDKISPEPNTLGLHYLHDNCGMDLPKGIIQNIVIPDPNSYASVPEQYCMKVFGELNSTYKSNSLVYLPAYNEIFDIKLAFKRLFETFEGNMKVLKVDADCIESLQCSYDLIISTIPLRILYDACECKHEEVYVRYDYPDDVSSQMVELFQHYTLYNTDATVDWYRHSRVQGQCTTEYTKPVRGCKVTRKVITEDIDRQRILDYDRIFLTGRWGAWDRKQLAHHSYYNTLRVLKEGIIDAR